QILDELQASDTDLPFTDRLRARATDWSHTSGMALAFSLDDLPSLPAATEDSLLRIVDEALANVLRHSGADRVEITLRRTADRARLAIIDNGRGMPDDANAGMGLGNMRERAQALRDGRFDIDTPPGGGTSVSISFVLTGTPSP
ncbi:MAG: ATP-binding protein, partial [Rhodanobacteraceae bacterium]